MSGIIRKVKSLIRLALCVKTKHGYGFLTQLRDIYALKKCNPTCGVKDYYTFRLYDRDRCSRNHYRNFAGVRMTEKVSMVLNPRGAVSAGWNKLVFLTIAEAHAIPVPVIRGAYKPQGSLPSFVPQPMKTRDDVRDFLTRPENFPLYVKPAHSQQGIGGMYLTGYDAAGDQIITKSEKRYSFEEFMGLTIDFPDRNYYCREAGYLFQDIIPQHRKINEFTGTRVPSGFRIVVLNDGVRPVIHRASWKIVCAGNTNDNLRKGKSGNFVAVVDLKTGKLSDAVNGMGPEAIFVENHPLTGKPFRDFTIPLWDQLVDQVVEVSKIFSPMRILHWDVIITNDGPVFLELNDLGSVVGIQLHGRGMMDENMKIFMKRHANFSICRDLEKFVNR